MSNNKKKMPTATIVVDKLVLTCTSIVEDNFDYIAKNEPIYTRDDFEFNDTKLICTIDPSNRYRYSYKIQYKEFYMGTLDFELYTGLHNDKIRIKVDNEVFYNNTLQYISNVIQDLNLHINNIQTLDIAVDSYKHDSEQKIRCSMLNKTYQVKMLGKIIKDRNQTLIDRIFFNIGSLNNPYQSRSLVIRGAKRLKELICYDKMKEIDEVSKKYYIAEFHKSKNPKLKNIYRTEIRFQYEELKRYSKKIKRVITFEDLLNPQFLSDMFFDTLDKIITIYDGSGRKKRKIQLVEKPLIEQPQCILQPTQLEHTSEFYNSNNQIFITKIIDNQIIINYDINKYNKQDIKLEIFNHKLINIKQYLELYKDKAPRRRMFRKSKSKTTLIT